MATFRTYAEVLNPDHPMMKNHKATATWRPSRYRPGEIEQAMRAEPGVVLGDVLQRTGGAYETTTRLTPKFREDIREIAELISDNELLRIAELPEVPHCRWLSARCHSGRESTAAPPASASA
jgi:hypothetical protein